MDVIFEPINDPATTNGLCVGVWLDGERKCIPLFFGDTTKDPKPKPTESTTT